MPRVLRDNGLSIVLFLLFFASAIGQSLTGHAHYNEDQREHKQPPVSYFDYLHSSAFVESIFENWESEFLQMALYVWLTSFLVQKGSAESKDPDESDEVDEDELDHRLDKDVPQPVRTGGLWLKIYRNSLGLALFVLFIASFVLHLVGSAGEACHQEKLHGGACSTVVQHLGSSTFWFESFQNWQSEFLSIGVLVILSIFLRQKGSPESKPVHASNAKTGK